MHKLPVGKQRALLTRIERALRPTDPAAADAASALVLQLEPFTRGLNSREGRSSLGGSSASASFAAVGIDSYLPTGTARPAQQLRTHLDAEGAVVNFISLRNAFSWLTAPALLNALLARQAIPCTRVTRCQAAPFVTIVKEYATIVRHRDMT